MATYWPNGNGPSTADELMAAVKKFIDEEGEELIAALEFKSPFRFEPRLTRKLFNKKAAAQPATPDDGLTTVFQTFQLYEKCDKEKDLNFFIHVFHKYGSVQKVLSKAGADAAFISRKCDIYGISTKLRYPSRGHYEDITLSRIARAFPVQTSKVILKEQFAGILTFSSFFQQHLPLIMQHTIFAGLVPKGQPFHLNILDIAAVLNMEISVKLAKPEEKSRLIRKTVEEAIKDSKSHIYKVSNLDEDGEKLEILTEAGVLEVNANGDLEPSALTALLLNKLTRIRAVYSFTYSEAVEKLKL